MLSSRGRRPPPRARRPGAPARAAAGPCTATTASASAAAAACWPTALCALDVCPWFYFRILTTVRPVRKRPRKLINPLALAPAPVGAGGAVDIVQGRQLHDVRRCTARYRCRRQDD
jgi:hypothetical protein